MTSDHERSGAPQLLEFGCASWFAALRRCTEDALARYWEDAPDAAANLTYSMSEIVTTPPAHLAGGATEIGWYCAVENGRLQEFRAGPEHSAMRVVIADYPTLLACSQYRTEGDPEKWRDYMAMTRRMWEEGRIEVRGEMLELPKSFASIHDEMARMTA